MQEYVNPVALLTDPAKVLVSCDNRLSFQPRTVSSISQGLIRSSPHLTKNEPSKVQLIKNTVFHRISLHFRRDHTTPRRFPARTFGASDCMACASAYSVLSAMRRPRPAASPSTRRLSAENQRPRLDTNFTCQNRSRTCVK